jgi:hypothetical protein
MTTATNRHGHGLPPVPPNFSVDAVWLTGESAWADYTPPLLTFPPNTLACSYLGWISQSPSWLYLLCSVRSSWITRPTPNPMPAVSILDAAVQLGSNDIANKVQTATRSQPPAGSPGNLRKPQWTLDLEMLTGPIGIILTRVFGRSILNIQPLMGLSACPGYFRGEPAGQAWEKESARRRRR